MGLLYHFISFFFRQIIRAGIKKITLAGIFLLGLQLLVIQEKQFLFTNIDKSQGLSPYHVQCFLKDKKGFIAQIAYAGTEDEVMFRQEGFYDYPAKPISYSDLLYIPEKYF